MVSVIIPAFNEAPSVRRTVESLKSTLTERGIEFEIIVVDDASSDTTADEARATGAKVISHGSNHGYGQAIRTGIAASSYDHLAIMDADGTYPAEDLIKVFDKIGAYDMVVGARTGDAYTKGFFKYPARRALISMCEFVTGTRIPDINSGLRVFRKAQVIPFMSQLSYGFSFTTSLTLCMLLNGYFVGYVDIGYGQRHGLSHVHHYRDTLRTFQIVVEAFARYNPLKLALVLILCLGIVTSVMSLALSLNILGFQQWLLLYLFICTASILVGIGCLAVPSVRRADRLKPPAELSS